MHERSGWEYRIPRLFLLTFLILPNPNTASDEDDESKMSASSLSSPSFPSPSSSALSAFMRDQQQQQLQQGAEGEASSSSTSTSPDPLSPLPGTTATATAPVPSKKKMDESMGDEYQRIAAQKARGEQRLAAMTASKEHARRKFPLMRRVYTDYHLKVMVAGEAGHGKTTYVLAREGAWAGWREGGREGGQVLPLLGPCVR